MSVIQIHSWLNPDEGYIAGEVHDSIILEVKNAVLGKIAKKVVEIMRHPQLLDELEIKLTVPLDAEAKAGVSLGEMKELKL